MAYTADQIAQIRAAIAAGATTIKDGEKQTTFRSLAEMRQILAMMEAEYYGTSSVRRPNAVYGTCRKGY